MSSAVAPAAAGSVGAAPAHCPEVVAAEFWLPHDSPHGIVGYDAQGKPVDPAKTPRHRIPRGAAAPLYLDERSHADVTALYRVMLTATFCVSLGGDTPSRKSTLDAIQAQCIPVIFSFRNDSMAMWQLPFRARIPYEQLVLLLPLETLTDTGAPDVVQQLRAVPEGVIRAKQAAIRRWGPMLRYTYGTPPQPVVRTAGGGAAQMALQALAYDQPDQEWGIQAALSTAAHQSL